MVEKQVKLGLLDTTYQYAISSVVQQSKVLKAPASYLLSVITERSAEHLKKYDVVRKELLAKYGKKDEAGELVVNEEGTQYVIENTADFFKEYDDLANLEVSLPELPLSYLADIALDHDHMKALANTILNPQA